MKTTSTPRVRRGLRRLGLCIAVAGAAVVLAALPASAHIVVSVPGGTIEGLGNLNFQVHNESETATIVKVTIDLPLDTPFAEVNPFNVPGWTITKVESKLPAPVSVGGFNLTKAVSSVTWTADAGSNIPAGELQMLTLNAGPYPSTGTLEFPTTLYLNDGSTVKWNQKTPADGSEPEFPTPELDAKTIVASDASMGTTPTPSASATPASASGSPSSSTANLALVISIVGVVLAAVALILAVTSRRKTST
jgi:periplasmic copper chaperone A